MNTTKVSRNNWSAVEVERAKKLWGDTYPQYSIDLYNFAISNVESWLDLGCGFGRFFKYLLEKVEEPNYIGYDSSSAMLDKFMKTFPDFSPLVFSRNIVDKIVHHQQSIICSAVLIHLTKEDQVTILNNVCEVSPNKFSFDINSHPEQYIEKGGKDYEKFIRGSYNTFRMTWQSHLGMTALLNKLFKNYSITQKHYPLANNRQKVVYFLEKR